MDSQVIDKRVVDRTAVRLSFLVFLGILVCLPLILFNEQPSRDTSMYYTPMIREIGDGNLSRGYMPIIPPLFSTTGGLFCGLGMHPFTAAKTASSLYFVLVLFPLFGIVRRLWKNEDYAFIACVLYLICHRLVRYAGAGLLDTGKTFFLTLTVYLLLRLWTKRSCRMLVYLALSLAGLALIRGEGVIFSALAGGFALVFLLKQEFTAKSFRRIAVFVVWSILFMLPWVLYCYHETGYPVTDARQLSIAGPILNKLGFSPKEQPAPLLPEEKETSAVPHPRQPLPKLLEELMKGFYPAYFLLALFGIYLTFRQKQWDGQKILLISVPVVHTLVLILFFWFLARANVQKRYVASVIPLFLGWTVAGGAAALAFMRRRFPRIRDYCYVALAFIFFLLSIVPAYRYVLPNDEKKVEAAATRFCGRWLSTRGLEMVPPSWPRLRSHGLHYRNGRLPIVLTATPEITMWGATEAVRLDAFHRTWTLEELKALCMQQKVNFIVVDEVVRLLCPEITSLEDDPDLVVMYDEWSHLPDGGYSIVGVVPNLRNSKEAQLKPVEQR